MRRNTNPAPSRPCARHSAPHICNAPPFRCIQIYVVPSRPSPRPPPDHVSTRFWSIRIRPVSSRFFATQSCPRFHKSQNLRRPPLQPTRLAFPFTETVVCCHPRSTRARTVRAAPELRVGLSPIATHCHPYILCMSTRCSGTVLCGAALSCTTVSAKLAFNSLQSTWRVLSPKLTRYCHSPSFVCMFGATLLLRYFFFFFFSRLPTS